MNISSDKQAKSHTRRLGIGLEREALTDSFLIAAQRIALRTNYVKARIDKTQQNSRCWLCGDRDETINHIISEWSELAQKGGESDPLRIVQEV